MELDRILVIDIAGIGDLVLAVPAIRALRKGYPDSYIAVLTSPRCIDVLKGCPYINDIFTLSSMLRLRAMRFDIAINLYQIASTSGAIKMRWLLRFIRPKLTAGRNTDGKGRFWTFKIDDGYKHEVDISLDIIKTLGMRDDGRHLELWLDRDEKDRARRILKDNGINDASCLIGVCPGSNQPLKRWRPDYFGGVIDYILNTYNNASAVIVGDDKDKVIARQMSIGIKKRCVILAGELTLRDTATIMSMCRVFITNDTGLMHIAAALGVCVVAIFGPSNPDRFGPYDRAGNKHIVIRRGIDINRVKVEDVVKAVDIQIQKTSEKIF